MKSKFIILLFSAFIVSNTAFTQNTSLLFKGNILPKKYADTATNTQYKLSPSMLVSPKFYSSNLAFFCRQEIKIEKTTKIPFKFRLGSVQQVDYLEGKHSGKPF